MRRSLTLAVLAATTLAAGACAPQDQANDAASGSSGGGACTPSALDTLEPETLTIATDEPAYEPWVVGDAPDSGEGFESAVAYAVAEELGYSKDQVTWTRVPFNAAIQPGARPFDFDINQFSITDERKQAVDFSSPYYSVSQAVITTAGSAADGVTSVADLKGLRVGAQVSTTSLQVLTDVIDPDAGPVVFNSNDDAKLALQNGQVDAIVVDLPTAFYITAAEIPGSTIVGQFQPTSGKPEQFGLLFEKGNELRTCVDKALASLTDDGTLADLEKQWLSTSVDVPVLK